MAEGTLRWRRHWAQKRENISDNNHQLSDSISDVEILAV